MNDTDRATALAHIRRLDAAAVAAKKVYNDAQKALWQAEDADREAHRVLMNARYEYQQKYGPVETFLASLPQEMFTEQT